MADRRKDTHPNLQATLFDAYAPDKIAERIEVVGVNKAGMTLLPTMTLAVLAGAFISFGAMFYSVTITGNDAGLGIGRMIGGLSFSLGLILVVVGGAELFTGNVLIVMGWANKRVSTRALLRNWGLVFAGNLAGALGMVVMAYASGYQGIGDGQVAETLVAIAAAKVNLSPGAAFIRGILCNALVCLAVWLCFAARSVTDKVLAIVFPITAFVALGFEHSVANMFFIPMGILVSDGNVENLNMAGFLGNLIPVTLGNIVGGGVFVALSYYIVYMRNR